MVRGLLYILLPLSTIIAILLISQRSRFKPSVAEWPTTSLEGENLWLYLGLFASQVAIKQLGTNGGELFGANSAHPFEIRRFFQTLSRI